MAGVVNRSIASYQSIAKVVLVDHMTLKIDVYRCFGFFYH